MAIYSRISCYSSGLSSDGTMVIFEDGLVVTTVEKLCDIKRKSRTVWAYYTGKQWIVGKKYENPRSNT